MKTKDGLKLADGACIYSPKAGIETPVAQFKNSKFFLKKEYPSAQLRWNGIKCSAIMYKRIRKNAISRLIAWLRCHI